MTRRGCKCCGDSCCVTPKILKADVSVGTLPTITAMEINPVTGCYAESDGVFGVTTHSLDGYERPSTTIKGRPHWGLNALMNGEWHVQTYSTLDRAFFWDQYGAVEECFNFGSSPALPLISQITEISGTFDLIVGNEPNVWPYWVKMAYYLFIDGTGDCILRVGAYFKKSDRQSPLNRTSGAAVSAQYLREGVLGGSDTWPHTKTPYKYSDYHPCAEDLGVLPWPPGQNGFITPDPGGVWESGEQFTLNDQAIYNTKFVSGGDYSETLITASDVASDDDAAVGGGEFSHAWIWEINLTDASVTDLASLPSTTLDWTNVKGTTTASGDIRDPYTPVGALPSGYFDAQWDYYTTGSMAIGPLNYIGKTEAPLGTTNTRYTIVNGGTGGHVCKTGVTGTCDLATGTQWTPNTETQADLLMWHLEWEVNGSTYAVPWKDFSITLKP